MIEAITGRIEELTPTWVVLGTQGGVSYRMEISLQVYTALEEGAKDSPVRLLVHEAIREDAWVLYGFIDERERSLFRNLIGVSGVGTASARLILSSIAAPELEHVIAGGDVSRLKSVKGIGIKTAQRIIVDLKGKVAVSEEISVAPEPNREESEVFNEALAALTMLGFTRQQSFKALKSIFAAQPDIKVENAIKKALALLH